MASAARRCTGSGMSINAVAGVTRVHVIAVGIALAAVATGGSAKPCLRWWDERTVGAVVVYGMADDECRRLALQARRAVAR
jgi:hypothetical protein